jgi:membrane associated rhomboid family serine protease
MGSYRDYYRMDYPQDRSSPLMWVISAVVAGFILQMVMLNWFDADAFVGNYLYLSADSIRHYRIWTLFSYSLLHSPSYLTDIIFAVIGLYLTGKQLVNVMSARSFLLLFLCSALAGAMLWVIYHWTGGGVLMGSWAAIYGLFFFYIALYPEQQISFLFLFIPITFPKSKYLGYALGFIALVGLAFFERNPSGPNIPHSAHLGGMLMGLAWHRFVYQKSKFRFPWSRNRAEVIEPAWAVKARQGKKVSLPSQINLSEKDRLRAEVDRILDKINSKGFGALTAEEKKTLDAAKNMMNKK